MTKIAFRSPVEVPLLRFGLPKPPGLPAHATFRVTKRSKVVKGQAITGGSPRTGFSPTDWFEARMKIGTKVELGYFHCSVLTNQRPLE